ncbi:MAG: beta-ketoacyl-ACP synthase III [bacterium]
MAESRRVQIVSTGAAVPEKVITNFDLEKMVDTSNEWIIERTGISRRHIVDETTATSDLAYGAAQQALEGAGVGPEEIDVIIVGTSSPDMLFPATGCLVQNLLGATRAAAFDVSAGCSGFLYALDIGRAMISTGGAETVLVIGAEILSKFVDWEDRSTCVLFGDGAGAVVLKPSAVSRGILLTFLKSDGSLGDLLKLPGGGTRCPATHESVDAKQHCIKMAGREVFKSAVKAMGDAAVHILSEAGLSADKIDLFIPHQANIRIIQATAKKIDIPMEKVYVNVDEYGNTSAASIPISLHEVRENGRLKEGDLCLMVSFGTGFTWASALVQF